MNKGKEIAICASTPFQMYNALNLSTFHIDDNYHKVLFYRNYSEETEKIIKRVKKRNLFDEIFEFNLKPKSRSLKYYWNDFIQATSPKSFIKSIVEDEFKIEEHSFDIITLTSGMELEHALLRTYPKARQIAFDDGIGSYYGDIIHDHKLKWIWTVLGRNKKHMHPEVLYVNNKDFCRSTVAEEIAELTPLDEAGEEYNMMINDIFPLAGSEQYKGKRLVYLTQPVEEIDSKIVNQIQEMESVLEKNSSNSIMRRHPRDKRKISLSMILDETNSLWEGLCNSVISDNHILVSVCSTAQIMPKILFNKEPWVVFTYKLYDYGDDNRNASQFDSIAQILRESYSDKNKIRIPCNIDELEETLQTALKSI